jgi:hypothetical protein
VEREGIKSRILNCYFKLIGTVCVEFYRQGSTKDEKTKWNLVNAVILGKNNLLR